MAKEKRQKTQMTNISDEGGDSITGETLEITGDSTNNSDESDNLKWANSLKVTNCPNSPKKKQAI